MIHTATQNNPNRCADCLQPDQAQSEFLPFGRGLCGSCGNVTFVWDLPHLAELRANGIKFTQDDPSIRPLRNSHTDEFTTAPQQFGNQAGQS